MLAEEISYYFVATMNHDIVSVYVTIRRWLRSAVNDKVRTSDSFVLNRTMTSET